MAETEWLRFGETASRMTDFGSVVKAVTEWPARYFFALALVAVALLLLSVSPWAAQAGIVAAPPWFRLSLTIATPAFSAIGLTKGMTHAQGTP